MAHSNLIAHSNKFDLLEPFSKGIRPYIILLFLLLGLSLYPAIKLAPLDRDESRFMQATTQMFETKDFINIRFQDVARNKKPVGIHWLQASVLAATGKGLAHDAFYFRIVSLLGAFLAAISTFLLGKQLFDRKTALLAASLFSITLLISTEAHIAKTDAALAGFIALAFYALAKLRFGTPSKFNIFLFWFALGFGVLIKGPVPIASIGLSVLLLVFLERDGKWLRPLGNVWAIGLFFAITLPWFILIAIKTNGQFYIDAIGKDLGEKITGKQENPSQPPGVHLLISPLILWPATLFIGSGFMAAIREFGNSKIKYLVAIIIPTWLIFELATGKLAHYTLPVHFAIALLMAYSLRNNYWQGAAKYIGLGLFFISSIILSLLPVALGAQYGLGIDIENNISAIFTNIEMFPYWHIFSVIFGVSVLAFFLALFNQRTTAIALISVALLFSYHIKAQLLVNLKSFNVSREVSTRLDAIGLHPRLDKAAAIIGTDYQEPSLIFLTRTDSHLGNLEDIIKYSQIDAPAIIEDAKLKEFNQAIASKNLIFKEIGAPIKGVNYSKGDNVILHIGILTTKPAT
jgi:4-amino-4-deoxy-L-arabinose transferase-like glycosyltransferase